ncbi:MAG: HEAT repeat domain-containing protein [Anaerolineales bacterium]|nr:HEAT repeat domain-containing protein [Anaerolineales bacterium]
MRLPRLPEIDALSFWLGFGLAALLAYALYRLRQQLADLRQTISHRFHRARELLTAGAERRLREDVQRFAQTAHLAGALFALDDVLVPPRLLLPEPPFDPTAPPTDPDLTSVIPRLPDWPELAAVYRAPTIDPAEALAGAAAGLLVLGAPGSGKTTLLAHLATRLARDELEVLSEPHTTIFVHAADLVLPLAPGVDSLEPLIAAAQARASALTAARLPRHLRTRLREYKCAVLLDGLDELPPPVVADVAQWLGQFRQAYPRHLLIAAASLWGYGPLMRLGLAPVLIAPWNAADYRALIEKWGAAWDKLIRSRKRRAPQDTDPHLILGWLGSGNGGRSVFEVTLKTWAALAGDARGKRPVDWMEAYVLRHGVKPIGQRGLGRLAAAMLERELSVGLTRDEAATLVAQVFAGHPGLDPGDFLDDLIARRLLARHRDRLTFQHGLVSAYCAAVHMAAEPEAAVPGQTPTWTRALYFYAALGELTPVVARRLNQAPDFLHSDVLDCAAWLRDSPAQARWRSEVMRRLSRLLMDSNQPEGLRSRALAAFVAAGDASVAALFKQGSTSPDAQLRRLSLLGLGAVGEISAVLQIASHFTDPDLEVRWAAALALGVLEHQSAIEALAKGLLVGDDHLRRACAEGLARHPEEGHPVLQEASAHADVSVRRAAVFGAAAARSDWAMPLIEELLRHEQQWLVRSAASDALARLREPASRALRPALPPDSQGWLVAWAAEQGLGVPPGRGALEVLKRAARDGHEATRRAAAGALGALADPDHSRELYPLLRDASPMVRAAAWEALGLISAAAGQRLAAPAA